MYVPDRKPAAHQVAAAQDRKFKGCYVYVESGCDSRLWKSFLDFKVVRIRACNGWENVIKTTEKGNIEENVCIGIIDRDFRDYVNNYGELPTNVFMSDEHDIEMTIIKAEGIERVINNFDSGEHIEKYEAKEGASVQECALEITNKIGILKLIDRREGLKLKLKKEGKGTEYELPNYERFLDKEGHYISTNKMIEYLSGWSTNNNSKPVKTVEEMLSLFEAEETETHDSYKLSNGHDVLYIVAYLLWKHISGERTNKDELEKLLRASFSFEGLMKTSIGSALMRWSADNGIKILKMHS